MKRVFCIIAALMLTLACTVPAIAVELPSVCFHSVYNWVTTTPATCTAAGVREYTCAYCGYVLETETIEATGHTYDGGVVTTVPTYTTTGVKTYTCTACGNTYTVETDRLPAVKGDLTLDGKVNALDLLRLKLFLSGKITLSEYIIADLTGEEKINALDLLKLKLFLSGKVLQL